MNRTYIIIIAAVLSILAHFLALQVPANGKELQVLLECVEGTVYAAPDNKNK